MGVLTSIAMGAVALGGTVKSYKEGKAATTAQKKGNKAQREINRLKNRQAKRSFMRGFRQVQGDVFAASVAQGIGLGGSTVQGQLQSNIAQMGTARREFQQMEDLGGEITKQMNRASNAQFKAGLAGQVGSFAGQFVDYGQIRDLFS